MQSCHSPRVQYRLPQVHEGLAHAAAVLGGHLEERHTVTLGQALALLAENNQDIQIMYSA